MAGFPKQIPMVLILLMAATSAFAQVSRNPVSVSGKVLSEGRNLAIQHAVVRLCDGGGNLIEQATTPDSGDFSFRGLQRSPYILTVEASGYQKEEIHLDLSFMSDRGMTIYLRPMEKEGTPGATGATVSAHELSMPEVARNLVASGRKKLYAEKNAQGGLSEFEQAVAKAPGYYEAYCEIAMAYVTLGKTKEAIGSYRKSIEASHDTYGEAEVGLGTLSIEKGELDAGEKAIRRGIELNPKSWRGYYEIGKLELGRGNLEEAVKSAEQTRTLAPGVPIVYRLLANIHMRQKNYAALLDDLNDYIKLDPSSPAGLRAAQMRDELAQDAARHAQGARTEPKPQ